MLLMASDVKRSRYCMISLSIFAHRTTLLYTLRKGQLENMGTQKRERKWERRRRQVMS